MGGRSCAYSELLPKLKFSHATLWKLGHRGAFFFAQIQDLPTAISRQAQATRCCRLRRRPGARRCLPPALPQLPSPRILPPPPPPLLMRLTPALLQRSRRRPRLRACSASTALAWHAARGLLRKRRWLQRGGKRRQRRQRGATGRARVAVAGTAGGSSSVRCRRMAWRPAANASDERRQHSHVCSQRQSAQRQ